MTLHEDGLTRAYRFAQSCALTEHSRGRGDEERQWLDVLALLDLACHPEPAVSDGEREGLAEAVTGGTWSDRTAAFGAWLEANNREVAGKALREAADALMFADIEWPAEVNTVIRWLDNRIERGA